jgi:hypothetical protein
MLELFILHSPADKPAATAIAARLERWGDVQALMEECETIPESWEGGLTSDAIVLLLSPDSVPGRPRLELWQPILEHLEGNASPPLGSVLVRDCSFPGRLNRKRFFRSDQLRELERWIMGLHPPSERPQFTPPPLPGFQGRRRELDDLWNALADGSGTLALTNPAPGSGKTWLAQQFVLEAGEHFRDVLWIQCRERSRTLIVGEVAWRLGVPATGSFDEVIDRVEEELRVRRVLLVFDDVTGQAPVLAFPEGRASVLMTARSHEPGWPDQVRVMPVTSGGYGAPACAPEDDALHRQRAESLRTATPRADLIAGIEAACEWAFRSDWDLAKGLARRLCVFLKAENRWMEAAHVYGRLRDAARERGDSEVEEDSTEELSWIQDGERIQPREITGEQLEFDFGRM